DKHGDAVISRLHGLRSGGIRPRFGDGGIGRGRFARVRLRDGISGGFQRGLGRFPARRGGIFALRGRQLGHGGRRIRRDKVLRQRASRQHRASSDRRDNQHGGTDDQN